MRPRIPILIVLMFACLALTTGCRKKPPQTAPDLAPPAAVMPVAEPETAPEPVAAPPVEADPLAGDLASVTDYLRSRGLLGDVYFDYDRSELSPEARNQLARSSQFLVQDPRFSLTLEGHCDERGTVEYNLALGERRAQMVKSYMVTLGVPASRLSTISYGEERPVCTEEEESCWRLNRRVHPVVTSRSGG